jgi:hypothetical protein
MHPTVHPCSIPQTMGWGRWMQGRCQDETRWGGLPGTKVSSELVSPAPLAFCLLFSISCHRISCLYTSLTTVLLIYLCLISSGSVSSASVLPLLPSPDPISPASLPLASYLKTRYFLRPAAGSCPYLDCIACVLHASVPVAGEMAGAKGHHDDGEDGVDEQVEPVSRVPAAATWPPTTRTRSIRPKHRHLKWRLAVEQGR